MTIEDMEAAAERFAEGREFLYDDAESYRGGVREGIRAIFALLTEHAPAEVRAAV